MAFDPNIIGIEIRSGIYPSVTQFSLSNKILTVTSNGDPSPAAAGNPLSSNLERKFSNNNIISDQDYDFSFNYRAGRNIQNPQPSVDNIMGILANGVALFGSVYNPNTLPRSDVRAPDNFKFNPVFFEKELDSDSSGGFVNNKGQYFYRSGKFLSTTWNTAHFYNNQSYYKATNFQGDRFRHPDGHSKIVGFCFDGYPIYGPFGYRNPTDNQSDTVRMQSSYVLKNSDDHRPRDWKFDSEKLIVNSELVAVGAGAFVEDYSFIRSRGTLDEHNGRFCVTPEYPQGTYAYFLTFEDNNLTKPAYPYVFGPTTKQNRNLVEVIRTKTIAPEQSLWVLNSGTTLTTLRERFPVGIQLPLSPFALNSRTTVELISGELPRGTRLEGTQIVGTALEVSIETLSTFVLRARLEDRVEDRTYRIVTVGADAPEWLTNEGLLPVGPNGLLFVLDSAVIDFQLSAIDRDLPAGDELEFFIAEGDGELPPGITISRDGKISGITDPLLSIDQRFRSGGYDEIPYDALPYDFGLRDDELDITVQPLKKLNRYYPFVVTVTDGVTFSRREFNIYVVGDDFLRSDNTVMKIATGVFTADNTFVRTPIWLTPSDLGAKRANNFVTLYLEVVDNPSLAGVLSYTLDELNDDGTVSELPPGMNLDSESGFVLGRVPYQPAISENYKFTVRATRYAARPGLATVFANFFEDTLLGNSSFKIFKIDLTGLEDGINDLLELKDQDIVIGNRLYRIINVDDSNPNFDTVFLDQTLVPEIPLILSRTAGLNQDHIFVSRLNESQTEKYQGRVLKFSDSEQYRITDIVPYLEYEIDQLNIQNSPILPAKSPRDLEASENYFIGDYVKFTSAAGGDDRIYICVEPHTVQPLLGQDDIPISINGVVQINFESSKWSFVADSLEQMSTQDKISATNQSLESEFSGPVYIQIIKQNQWRIRLPSNSRSRLISNIRDFFVSSEDSAQIRVTVLRDNEQRFQLDRNLTRTIQQGNNIGIALFARDGFSKTVTTLIEDDVSVPSKSKTFEIKIIGEIDTSIQWITDPNLGKINANFPSTIKVEAEADIPDTTLIYKIVKGRLPAGMRFSVTGEIIGAANQFADEDTLGLTTFDNRQVTWDGRFPGDTTFDRRFTFTVRAQDRFNSVAVDREFFIDIEDLDDTVYTDIFMKPLLKPEQRQIFSSFISDSSIFDPTKIYRLNDERFGLQTELKMLVFAGVEAKTIDNFVAAAAKNHKRKRYMLGNFKTAIAKEPGSNDIVYEVVYIEVIDPAASKTGDTRQVFDIKTENKITADSIQYAAIDDVTKKGLGYSQIPVFTRKFVRFMIAENNRVIIETRQSGKVLNTDQDDFDIKIRDSSTINFKLDLADSEPERLRPIANTIKADSNAVKVSNSKDQTRYISSIPNMRKEIRNIGKIERNFLPLWMRTPQEDLSEVSYVTAIPVCYCNPGTSKDILLNIQNANIDLTQINFDIDRYIVERSEGINQQQIILFANYQFNV